MPIDEKLAAEGSDWIAGQLTEEYGGFIAAELIDAIMEFEQEFRDAREDQELDHQTMAGLIFTKLTEEEGVPSGFGGMNVQLVQEVLHLEDEFLSLAGHARKIR